MHMETAQHQFTVTHFNLCHNEQFARRGKDVRGNNRIIGQIIVEDYLDIGSRPHPPMVHAKSARRDAISKGLHYADHRRRRARARSF
jgi:hypothetical protein